MSQFSVVIAVSQSPERSVRGHGSERGNLSTAVEGAYTRSECPATVALRLITRQPKIVKLQLRKLSETELVS